MRAVTLALTLVLFVGLIAPSLEAWGLDVHRRITTRVLDGLSSDIRPFFNRQRAFIIERSVDPDLWRVADLRSALGPEPPNHFLDIDDLGEPPPFTNVPREWDAFVARYGEEEAHRAGRLPWRAEEIYGRLVTALRDAANGTSPYAADNARYLAAVLAHYVQDAFVPFHAVRNYDGQLTAQHGIHARFETALVQRYWTTFTARPVAVTRINDVRAFMFDTLVESANLTAAILEADLTAAAGKQVYDTAYYRRFRSGAGAIAERRINDAVDATVSVITSAWEDAGRPTLPD